MASRKQNSFDGQNSDEMGMKDKLVSETMEQKDPYRAKASDFPVTAVMSRTGQSGAHGTAEGQDSMAKLSDNQCSPGDAERPYGKSGGRDMFKFEDRAAHVSSNFPVETNKGESEVAPSKIDVPESIDMTTGEISVRGAQKIKIGGAEDKDVKMG